MSGDKQQPGREAKDRQHRQSDVPSRLEDEARSEERGREHFTKPPVRDSSRQPTPETEPERLSAKEEPVSEDQRHKRDHPPAQESDRS